MRGEIEEVNNKKDIEMGEGGVWEKREEQRKSMQIGRGEGQAGSETKCEGKHRFVCASLCKI